MRAAGLLLVTLGFAPAAAQAPADSARPRYLLPDIAPDALVFDGKYFWFKPVIGIIGDYTWFDQDAASVAQVGTQADQADLRTLRFGLAARHRAQPRLELFVVVDYVESRRRVDDAYDVLDLALGLPLGPHGKVTIGKQKQPFVYEMTALAAMLPQQERLLSPFFVSRDVGIKVSSGVERPRIAFWVGWFNDWFTRGESMASAGSDYVVRVTSEPLASPDGSRYLHLGVGGRYREAEDGTLRFRGRPESNVSDYFIDTGDIPAAYAVELGLELKAVWRGWSLLTEWIEASVQGTGGPDPRFSGAYATVAWVVTGEHRTQDWSIGSGRAPVPRRRGGAWEIVARYGHVDAADQGVDGGVLDKWYLGVNWWASRQWKVGVGYGIATLDRGGQTGRTGITLARLQWLY